MVFPKVPDGADARAEVLPLIVAPYLWWAFMGDMWAATLELATSPLPFRDHRASCEQGQFAAEAPSPERLR